MVCNWACHQILCCARSPILSRARVGLNGDCDIIADWKTLPIADDSADFVLLAHALEAADDPKSVLREAVRVLRPEGRIFIIGFNPFSLLALFGGGGACRGVPSGCLWRG